MMNRMMHRGVSREFLPLPGEAPAEAMENRGLSRRDLAPETGLFLPELGNLFFQKWGIPLYKKHIR